jgi:hypothetical protein
LVQSNLNNLHYIANAIILNTREITDIKYKART